MTPPTTPPGAIALPYRFDTSNVWHTILKGAFGLNALLVLSVLASALMRRWPATIGLVVIELLVFGFTRLFVRYQEGSAGTLMRDRVEVESNMLLGLSLPGPRGTYSLERFSSIRVEFRSGPIDPGVQGGPNEVIWLVGRPGTPNVAIARTDNGAGRAVGRELAALVALPVEEVGAPREIRL
jgi:hypothetical protein